MFSAVVSFGIFALVLFSVQSLEDASTQHRLSTDNKNTCVKTPGVNYPLDIKFDKIIDGLKSKSILLIDVRNPNELLEDGELEGSVNLPLPEIGDAFRMADSEFLRTYKFPKPHPEDENVVLTCRSGRRVLTAYDILEAQGYCNVRVYLGSFLEWKAKGGPLVDRRNSKS